MSDQNVGEGYANFQLAKAILNHSDKAQLWVNVLAGMQSGDLTVGSRTPLKNKPAWVTLEVVTGGFATGETSAGGALCEYERELCKSLSLDESATRLHLNSWHLSEAGYQYLVDLLTSMRYDILVPEEAALLTYVWLIENGHADQAGKLLAIISHFFSELRFYPVSFSAPEPLDQVARISVSTVADAQRTFEALRAPTQLVKQNITLEVWQPYYDNLMQLVHDSCSPGGDFSTALSHIDSYWQARAAALVSEYQPKINEHGISNRYLKPASQFQKVLGILKRACTDASNITASDRHYADIALTRYAAKYGTPNGRQCQAIRAHRLTSTGLLYQDIANATVARLTPLDPHLGIQNLTPLLAPVQKDECSGGVVTGTPLPAVLTDALKKCQVGTIQELCNSGVLQSAEMVAGVLPMLVSNIRAMGFENNAARYIYQQGYQAFRKRRSVLLLNYASQVRINELPWVAAMESHRRTNDAEQALAKQYMEEVLVSVLSTFPHSIFPNRLVTELKALDKQAQLDIPFHSEIAIDIFMGEFNQTFVDAAKHVQQLLAGSLYTHYYMINTATKLTTKTFADLCHNRGDRFHSAQGYTSAKGAVEQQQVLTTQNLASAFIMLSLDELDLTRIIQQTYAWICDQLTRTFSDRRGKYKMLTKTSYAWRQMLFYVSVLPEGEQAACIEGMSKHLQQQPSDFQAQFKPIMLGLNNAVTKQPVHLGGGVVYVGQWL